MSATQCRYAHFYFCFHSSLLTQKMYLLKNICCLVRSYRGTVRQLQVILRAMDDIVPKVSLERPENEASKAFVLNSPADPDSDYSQVLPLSLKKTI